MQEDVFRKRCKVFHEGKKSWVEGFAISISEGNTVLVLIDTELASMDINDTDNFRWVTESSSDNDSMAGNCDPELEDTMDIDNFQTIDKFHTPKVSPTTVSEDAPKVSSGSRKRRDSDTFVHEVEHEKFTANPNETGWSEALRIVGPKQVLENGICVMCQEPTKYRCRTCMTTFYCSRTCQRLGWIAHRYECQPLYSLENTAISPIEDTRNNNTPVSFKNGYTSIDSTPNKRNISPFELKKQPIGRNRKRPTQFSPIDNSDRSSAKDVGSVWNASKQYDSQNDETWNKHSRWYDDEADNAELSILNKKSAQLNLRDRAGGDDLGDLHERNFDGYEEEDEDNGYSEKNLTRVRRVVARKSGDSSSVGVSTSTNSATSNNYCLLVGSSHNNNINNKDEEYAEKVVQLQSKLHEMGVERSDSEVLRCLKLANGDDDEAIVYLIENLV